MTRKPREQPIVYDGKTKSAKNEYCRMSASLFYSPKEKKTLQEIVVSFICSFHVKRLDGVWLF